jgi:serine/threonine-protein kinase
LPNQRTGESSTRLPAGQTTKTSFVFGEYRLEDGLLYKGFSPVAVPPRAVKVLRRLLESPGELVEKSELVRVAWDEVAVTDNSLSEVIGLLRSSLGDTSRNARYIQTVHRRGYRWLVPVSVESTNGSPSLTRLDEEIRPSRKFKTASIVLSLLTLAVLAAWFLPNPLRSQQPNFPSLAARFELNLPPGARLAALRAGFHEPLVALSKDGRRLAYVGLDADGVQRLFLRDLEGLEVRPLRGTEGASNPFFSPDGVWIAFFAEGKLKKIPLDGGPSTVLASASHGFGGDWSEDGDIVFIPSPAGDLLRVSESGGSTEVLVSAARLEKSVIAWPRVLPGKRVLFTQSSGLMGPQSSIAVVSLETGEQHTLVEDGSSPFFVPPNYLLFARERSVWATVLDIEQMRVRAPPRLLESDVMTHPPVGTAQVAISPAGVLAYGTGGSLMGLDETLVVIVDRAGGHTELPIGSRFIRVRPAPDGRRLALARVQQNMTQDVWVYDLVSQHLSRLTYDGSLNEPTAWSPDGRWVAYFSDRGGVIQPYRKLADGSGQVERIGDFKGLATPLDWSMNDEFMVLEADGGDSGFDLWIWEPHTGRSRPIVKTPHRETDARISPDMRWLAYHSNSSGRYEIYVHSLFEPFEIHQVTTEGGSWPQWSPTGEELFFLRERGIWSTEVETATAFSSKPPSVLFEGNYLPAYGVMPDGRFAMVERKAEPGPTRLVVVMDLFGRLGHLFAE